jgi:hypothetical protein
MRARDVVADQPAGRGAYQDVGRKVLLAKHAGQADSGCQSLDTGLHPVRGIAVR